MALYAYDGFTPPQNIADLAVPWMNFPSSDFGQTPNQEPTRLLVLVWYLVVLNLGLWLPVLCSSAVVKGLGGGGWLRVCCLVLLL